MKNNLYLIILILALGCSGNHSLREQQILSNIPEDQRDYAQGIKSNPSTTDIEYAVKLGQGSKNDDTLLYAYLQKGPTEFWGKYSVYLKVLTPLYLVADHARAQAREYKEIDSRYVEFCKQLGAAKISLIQQFNSNFVAFPVKRDLILLYEGKRVEALASIKSYNGTNVLASESEKAANIAVANAMEKYKNSMPSSTVEINDEYIQNAEATYKAQGYTKEQIAIYMNALRWVASSASNTQKEIVALLESDNIYRISDLNKSGKYEIVFRTPATNNLLTSGDKEIRFPISFGRFK